MSAYEINVARNGQHLFATAERSCQSVYDLCKVYTEIKARFPANEGFAISVTYWVKQGQSVNAEKLVAQEAKR